MAELLQSTDLTEEQFTELEEILEQCMEGAWFCRERTLHEEIDQWNKSSDRKTQAGKA